LGTGASILLKGGLEFTSGQVLDITRGERPKMGKTSRVVTRESPSKSHHFGDTSPASREERSSLSRDVLTRKKGTYEEERKVSVGRKRLGSLCKEEGG